MNFFGNEKMDQEIEEDTFRKFGIPTKQFIRDELEMDVDDEDIIPMESEKFYISSHGSRLLHDDFEQLIIPDNMTLYFQTEFGNTCSRYDWEDMIPYICYHEDFLDSFRNVSTGGWINQCPPGTVIHDCLLTPGEKFLSNIMVCDKTVGPQIILNLNPRGVLLSEALRQIMLYALSNRLSQPYNIFCSFCLVDNYDSLSELNSYYGGKRNRKNKKRFKKKSVKKNNIKRKICRRITRRKINIVSM